MNVAQFNRLIEQLRTATPRPEISLEEVPAPQKLATYSFAFTADVSNGLLGDAEDEIASGRFVLLHEPGGQDTWEGEFRCVTFLSADVDEVLCFSIGGDQLAHLPRGGPVLRARHGVHHAARAHAHVDGRVVVLSGEVAAQDDVTVDD